MELTSTSPKLGLLKIFRNLALIEGVSMIVLLMFSVLKRTSFAPEFGALGVRYVGALHGALVIAFIYLLVLCWNRYGWSFQKVSVFFGASLIPFAPFWVDKKLTKEIKEREAALRHQ
jgi:integral membrane protein